MEKKLKSVIVIILGVFLFASPLFARQIEYLEEEGNQIVEVAAGEALVKFKTANPQALSQSERVELGIDSVKHVGNGAVVLLHSTKLDVPTFIDKLSRADVEYAEPNFMIHPDRIPDDPSFGNLWGLRNTGQFQGTPGADIGAVSTWNLSTGSRGIVIGVVDSGIDYTHSDLAPNMWSAPSAFTVYVGGRAITCPAGSHGFDAINLGCNPTDDYAHGTHLAGILGAAGNNSLGVVGVNWTTSIMSLRFISFAGFGWVSDAVNAIEFAIQAKSIFGSAANVRVLNNSWGSHNFSQTLLDEINRANGNGMLFVASAGNNGPHERGDNDTNPYYPASYNAPNVISVAATDYRDALTSISSFGSHSVHLGAPGTQILSTMPGGSYDYYDGTSMATAYVSGAAALVLSTCSLDTAELKETILSNTDPVSSLAGRTITGGRLNVYNSLCSCNPSACVNQHVYQIYSDPRTGDLHTQDLTALTGGSPAAPGSALTSYTDSIRDQHISYTADQHIHQLYYNARTDEWSEHDLTAYTGGALAAPGSALISFFKDQVVDGHIFYLGEDGHVHHLFHSWIAPWDKEDLTALTGGPPAAPGSALTGYTDSIGDNHIFYTADQHIHQLYYNARIGKNGEWSEHDLTAYTGGALAAPGTALTSFGKNEIVNGHLFYLDVNGHLHHLIHSWDAPWREQDVTALTGGPPAAFGSPLTSFPEPSSGNEYVFYLDRNRHVHQSFFDKNAVAWYDLDQSAYAGGPPAASRSPLTSFLEPSRAEQVFYMADDGDVYVIYSDPRTGELHHQNQSAYAGAPPAASEGSLSTFLESSNSEHIFYLH